MSQREQKYSGHLRVRLDTDRRKQLEAVAHDRSEPGDRVTVSDIVREAIDDHLEEIEIPDYEDEEEE